jgi:putative membrane protein
MNFKTKKSWMMMVIPLLLSISTGAKAAGPKGKVEAVSDAEIASIMKTANDAEISAAKLASKRAKDQEVKNFAQQMIDEHSQNEKDEKDLAKKAGIKMEKSDMAKMLKQDADAKTSDLKSLKGLEFDKAYIAQQVDMHQQLLSQLSNKFIPAAQNPEMKSFLEQTKTHVQMHLDHAKKIQTALAATPE